MVENVRTFFPAFYLVSTLSSLECNILEFPEGSSTCCENIRTVTKNTFGSRLWRIRIERNEKRENEKKKKKKVRTITQTEINYFTTDFDPLRHHYNCLTTPHPRPDCTESCNLYYFTTVPPTTYPISPITWPRSPRKSPTGSTRCSSHSICIRK